MKVRNIEKFREELYKNVKSLYFTDCDIRECGEAFFDEERLTPENKEDKYKLRHLYNALYIRKYNTDESGKDITVRTMFITVDDDDVHIYYCNTEKQCYDIVSWMCYDYYQNRIEFSMELAIKIANFARSASIYG